MARKNKNKGQSKLKHKDINLTKKCLQNPYACLKMKRNTPNRRKYLQLIGLMQLLINSLVKFLIII